MPSAIPFGILTYSFIFFFSTPDPLQVPQKCLIFCPSPPHAPHVVFITNIPCVKVCVPDPLQLLHFSGWVPGFALLPLQVEQVSLLSY